MSTIEEKLDMIIAKISALETKQKRCMKEISRIKKGKAVSTKDSDLPKLDDETLTVERLNRDLNKVKLEVENTKEPTDQNSKERDSENHNMLVSILVEKLKSAFTITIPPVDCFSSITSHSNPGTSTIEKKEVSEALEKTSTLAKESLTNAFDEAMTRGIPVSEGLIDRIVAAMNRAWITVRDMIITAANAVQRGIQVVWEEIYYLVSIPYRMLCGASGNVRLIFV